MTIFKGFVKKINTKEGRGKNGKPWKLYSAKLEKEDGTEYDQWISFGFSAPSVSEGDYVKLTTEKDDRGYEQVTEAKRLKNAPARAAKSSSDGVGTETGSRQSHIHYQSSRKDAIAVLTLLQTQDALPLSNAKTKAGEAKRYEEIMALVDKLTVRFYGDVETLRVLKSVADEGAVTADAASLPDDSDEEDEDEEAAGDEEGADDDDEDDE